MDTFDDARRQDRRGAAFIENAAFESYNRAVSTARISGHFLVTSLAILLALLGAGACERKQQTADPGAINAKDRADTANGPADTTPLPGIDASKLDEAKQKQFYKLVGSLVSPCGKAHSLRKSVVEDTSCKRAPYAAKYVLALVEDEAAEAKIREDYAAKYETKDVPKLDVSKAPRLGNDDANVVQIVEFYDYGCPHCREFKSILEQVLEAYRDKVSAYFLMFPLGNWPDSKSAAQAALAANELGKFKEMHAALFEHAPQHSREAVMGYAKDLGLDMAKFTAAYEAAGPHVDADHAQGEKVEVHTTPTLFINGRKFSGLSWKYLTMWIDEEAAVNR